MSLQTVLKSIVKVTGMKIIPHFTLFSAVPLFLFVYKHNYSILLAGYQAGGAAQPPHLRVSSSIDLKDSYLWLGPKQGGGAAATPAGIQLYLPAGISPAGPAWGRREASVLGWYFLINNLWIQLTFNQKIHIQSKRCKINVKLKWDNNRKPFHDLKMLLLDPMRGDAYLKTIANILRADVITISVDISNELLTTPQALKEVNKSRKLYRLSYEDDRYPCICNSQWLVVDIDLKDE
ncbi:hypothetical protein DERF_011228 [Dermatophagoides farinae]|uniref:Uncharacterized protein n=1 Tax=Dermatophagoides farinae TaxID=6954 RepID=A0A922KZ66_DERFA|nr:hypothetical protein DERF_011228 [Dermatophagoides farinae]